MTRGALSLDQQCRAAGLPVPVGEYKFHPTRRWRFDWAFLAYMLAVEVDGGSWITGGGRHTRGVGFERDCEKIAEAMCLGWRVLGVTPGMVQDGRALGYLERLMKGQP